MPKTYLFLQLWVVGSIDRKSFDGNQLKEVWFLNSIAKSHRENFGHFEGNSVFGQTIWMSNFLLV